MRHDVEHAIQVHRAAREILREAAEWDLRWTEAEAVVREKLNSLRQGHSKHRSRRQCHDKGHRARQREEYSPGPGRDIVFIAAFASCGARWAQKS
jgi:hypothetical protein